MRQRKIRTPEIDLLIPNGSTSVSSKKAQINQCNFQHIILCAILTTAVTTIIWRYFVQTETVCYPCNINSWETMHALQRVKSRECREQLLDEMCHYRKQRINNSAYVASLCPLADPQNIGTYLGCYEANYSSRHPLIGYMTRLPHNSPQACTYLCLQLGYSLAGVRYRAECHCGSSTRVALQQKTWANANANNHNVTLKKTVDSSCQQYTCATEPDEYCGGVNALAVYKTGFGDRHRYLPYKRLTTEERNELNGRYPIGDARRPRVVFLLQLNGRNIRQVRRLLKAIYRPRHYYYVHVDPKAQLMQREMERIGKLLAPMGNFHVRLDRFEHSWGLSGLLRMNIDAFKELLESTNWDWDLVTNLSESDFPVAPVEDLELILMKYPNTSFIGGHGDKTYEFIKAQGLHKMFVECEQRLWLVGDRDVLPRGLTVEGGSAWFGLDRSFVDYIAHGDDPVLTAARDLIGHAVLPEESFFHVVAANSRFCSKVLDHNHRLVSWAPRRERTCSCHFQSIDWCGCRPKVLTVDVLNKSLQNANDEVFGRKFDSSIDQEAVAWAEKRVLRNSDELQPSAQTTQSLHYYWLNEHDELDDDFASNNTVSTLFQLLARQCWNEKDSCQMVTIKQVNLFRRTDQSQLSLLVLYDLSCASENVTTEVLFDILSHQTVSEESYLGFRLLSLQVGTNYDDAEQLFRNRIGIVKPGANITARLEWQLERTQGNLTLKSTPLNIMVMWIGPNGLVDTISSLVAKRSPFTSSNTVVQAVSFVPQEGFAATAGIWKCRIVVGVDQTMIGETDFYIFPNMISEPFGNTTCATEIDQFYRKTKQCLSELSQERGLRRYDCGSVDDIKLCSETEWSSLSSDPKSEITAGYDTTSGRLF